MIVDGIEVKLPDPYQYPYDYYQVRIPTGKMPTVDPDNISEWAEITDKTATFEKKKFVEAGGSRSIVWVLKNYE